jgi:CTP synthase
VELHDSYLSVREALIHAGVQFDTEVDVRWVQSEGLEDQDLAEVLAGVSGIIVPGGFGERGSEGEIRTAQYARENGVPYLGLCRGMQLMVVEFARNVLGLDGASSTEFDAETADPVISLLAEQNAVTEMGGTMRLGHYPCQLVAGSKAQTAYDCAAVNERHRHRWEFNNTYREALEAAGLRASGLSPDGSLVEIAEVVDHPFMMGSQFHPELRSRPGRPHPLFFAFMGAALGIACDSVESGNSVDSGSVDSGNVDSGSASQAASGSVVGS